jgi:hypothetical protein
MPAPPGIGAATDWSGKRRIDGAFIGAVVRLDPGYRFIATDIRLADLDGSIRPSLADVQPLARVPTSAAIWTKPAHRGKAMESWQF